MASLEEPAWGLILLYGAQRRFCRAKTLLCGWRAHFCRFNADLPLHLNHGVASPFPPRVKVGSETLMESLSTGAGSQSPRGACFVRSAVTPFPLNLRVARVYVPSHKAKEVNTARPRAGKACLSSPPSPAPSSIKQQYSNINVPFLFAVTCCGYSDFSYSN